MTQSSNRKRTSTSCILEHLFLARIRYHKENSANFRLPTGLQEPVKRHPYLRVYALLKKTLPLPRFSAQSGSAFFMCADFLLSKSAPQLRSSPIHLLSLRVYLRLQDKYDTE
ncbi:uncharacterized protein EDB91DRAFT_1065101 [Suillus paluster]|uniref:uncharacterized protein n=1 Tax=Suillus paluster TaxID=48578 RepID=UPI001B85EFE2|nr:uncharacterized protein EDB91DRAFT_1065101 [Suillus paluster]KAG1720027.1 hypothetical protein EDB91DRAFT_1065101 [Suillus paluster]